jgi:hypothetical protein
MADERVEKTREGVLAQLRERVGALDMARQASALEADYDAAAGELRLTLLGREFVVTRDLEVRGPAGQASYEDQVVILNSLLRPGGPAGEGWVPFRELAAGHYHDFHDEAEVPLAQAADEICAAPEKVAAELKGRLVEPIGGCDACIEVPVFSDVKALLQIYLEDMEFPADAKVLFSRGADRYLPPGCLEEVGRQIAARARKATGVKS